ncbi:MULTISPECIES: transcriptional regulator [unclassified Pseudomonas]|uniref:transcriptional regulator n=1 Tax=unclassified Pseudomonas TaxID=196821 RepID=UPI000D381BEE|nr:MULTISPECIES: transcriptional regulator [unclassified Pseudomonas]RAU43450.1 XRE family transcriptional regulator [Pseudomonas sp. RIT 409]RAU50014.1 XRE family transcriptional regulator [Pseudomonas sp. RIT 412]
MKIIKHYTPPSTSDLETLKGELGKTGNEMAAIAGLSDGRQWRKYTGGASPRELSAQMLFFIAARLTLPEEQLDAIYEQMRTLGAELEFDGDIN